MTKKDFELIAAVLKANKPYVATEEWAFWDRLCNRFAQQLLSTNPRFDVGRFLAAVRGENEL